MLIRKRSTCLSSVFASSPYGDAEGTLREEEELFRGLQVIISFINRQSSQDTTAL